MYIYDLKEKLKKVPKKPGVYIMLDNNKNIIYIGKAKILKNRLNNYFQNDKNHSLKTMHMIKNIYDFNFIITSNEYEALVLECNLIKIHRPKYNILLKDSKGYYFIKIVNEKWPRAFFVSRKDVDNSEYIGPFMNSNLRNLFYEIFSIFKIATCNRIFYEKDNKNLKLKRPCLNYYIKKCSAPCYGLILKDEYIKNFNMAIEVFKNPSKNIIDKLKYEMIEMAKKLYFERAAFLRDVIKSLIKIKEKQKIIYTKIKDQDVFAFVKNNDKIQVEIFIFRCGSLENTKDFLIDINEYNKDENDFLKMQRSKFLILYYQEQKYIPEFLTVDGEVEYKKMIEKKFSLKYNKKIKILIPKKGEQLEIVKLCLKNAEELLIKSFNNDDKINLDISVLFELSKILNINKIPYYIESYDISNFSGKWNAGSMVVFKNAVPLKCAYRKFKIKNFLNNDYGSLEEILERRFKRYLLSNNNESEINNSFSKIPDLIFVDGGIGHTSCAKNLLKKLNIEVPVFGIVKDENHKTKGITDHQKNILIDDKNIFKLIVDIQNETHRFAINFHRKLRKI